jgi:glutathione S-transferase
LRLLDAHLATRKFLVSERFTIADITLFAYTHCAGDGGFDLAPYAALGPWFSRVRAQRGHLPIGQVPSK